MDKQNQGGPPLEAIMYSNAGNPHIAQEIARRAMDMSDSDIVEVQITEATEGDQ